MNAPILYIPNALEMPDHFFRELTNTLDWQKRGAPREEYYCNDFPFDYTYGKGRGERTYKPQPWTAALNAIRHIAQDVAQTTFDVCFLNRYLNQHDQLGWHSDDSPEMDDARPIAIVSLGVEREIWFRPWGLPLIDGAKPVESPQKLRLGHGSICVMKAGMQDAWQHRIPKADRPVGERISLTFRGYVKVPQ